MEAGSVWQRRRPLWMIKLNAYGHGDWRRYADVV
jgi:hypothetical protein